MNGFAEAVELYRKWNPDLMLVDLRMPVKNGIQATLEICAVNPNARVLILTTFDGDAEIDRALKAGALGYVLKSATQDKLIPALRAVAAGQRWIPKDVANRLASRRQSEDVTPREVQVLQLLSTGLANKEIAAKLSITEYTVKDHLKSILAKLQVADRTGAVTAAIQRGIIQI